MKGNGRRREREDKGEIREIKIVATLYTTALQRNRRIEGRGRLYIFAESKQNIISAHLKP